MTDFAIITIVDDEYRTTYQAGSAADKLLSQSDPIAVISGGNRDDDSDHQCDNARIGQQKKKVDILHV